MRRLSSGRFQPIPTDGYRGVTRFSYLLEKSVVRENILTEIRNTYSIDKDISLPCVTNSIENTCHLFKSIPLYQ